MGFLDSIKKSLSMSEEEYLDDVDVQEEEEEEYVPRKRHTTTRARQYEAPSDNVVNFKAAPASSPAAGSKAHVVFKKVDSFEEVAPVADVLNEKRIAILNLETCPTEDSRRIIDFLSGVAYANDATIQRVAGRAYIITPNNVPLSGELLDEMVNSAAKGLF